MNYNFIFLLMIFLHIVDDYYLQGILASMKQKSWWQKQEGYESKYKYDYIVALIVHGLSWSFMIMLPLAYLTTFKVGFYFLDLWLFNGLLHAYIDNLKANKKTLNLIEDQFLHLFQIILVYCAYIPFLPIV